MLLRKLITLILICSLLIPSIPASAESRPSGFTDTANHWARKTVDQWLSQELIKGYEDDTFRPDGDITRAEFVALINRKFKLNQYQGKPDFIDISSRDWFYKDVAIARVSGYVSGYQDGTFLPHNRITREEASVILYRMLEEKDISKQATKSFIDFTDRVSFANWSSSSILRLSQLDVLSGYPDHTFRPSRSLTRAESITILDRFAQVLQDNQSVIRVHTPYLETTDADAKASFITIRNPAADKHYTKEDTISLTGLAAGQLDKIEYRTDDGRTGEVPAQDQWIIGDLQLMQPSTQVTVRMTDGHGKSYQDSIEIIKDVDQPRIQLTDKNDLTKQFVLEDHVSLSGTANDAGGLDRVIYSAIHNDKEVDSGTAVGTEHWYIPRIKLKPGTNKISLKAFDKAGNEASKQLEYEYNPYYAFQEELILSEPHLFVNEAKSVKFSIKLNNSSSSKPDKIVLVRVSSDGASTPLIALNDDGNIAFGDDIGGDGEYSGIYEIQEHEPGTLMFRAELETPLGKLASNESRIEILTRTTAVHYQQFVDVSEKLRHLDGQLLGKSAEQRAEGLIKWLDQEAYIRDSGLSASEGSIWFSSTEGLKGAYLLRSGDTKGAEGVTGQWTNTTSGSTTSVAAYTSSNNVLIASPFASKGLTAAAYDELQKKFDATQGYNVNRLKDEAVTVEIFKKLGSYGVILLDTHGEIYGGKLEEKQVILTGEKATAANKDKYEADVKAERLVIIDGNYAVTPDFFTFYKVTLPNSLIFNASCLSLSKGGFAEVFLQSGAKTYLGYTGAIKVSEDQAIVTKLFEALLTQNQTAGEAYDHIKKNAIAGNNLLQLDGERKLSIRSESFNTSFEDQSLDAWDKQGDVRVVTQLGSILPTHGKYMALLSTGMNAVEDSFSSISRSITVPEGAQSIIFNYNVVSEEPMEWVDSEYDDRFVASLSFPDGTSVTLATEAVNSSTWTSIPGLNLDGGDQTAYMTTWNRVQLDISQYSGKGKGTITFFVEDQGDADYDTVILLDDIAISFLKATDLTDNDQDGIPDELELSGIPIGYNGVFQGWVKLDPTKADTDGDGISDGAELLYLRHYNQTGGFFEAIDHPDSPTTSIFSRDINASPGAIVDLYAQDIEAFKNNIVEAEKYRSDLLEYYNKIVNHLYEIKPQHRNEMLIYLNEIRTFSDTLTQLIGNYAAAILSSPDAAAKEWLLSSNIALLNSGLDENDITNPLYTYQKINIHQVVDTKIYNDDGPVNGGYEEFKVGDGSAKVQQLYTTALEQLPITPYASYEYYMNSTAFLRLAEHINTWWSYNEVKSEFNRFMQYASALKALRLRNNPCSYVPNGCGEGSAVFNKFSDGYFYITYKAKDGTIHSYSVEADLGVQPSNQIQHVAYALIEPDTQKVRFLGRTSNAESKKRVLLNQPKYASYAFKILYQGPDLAKAIETEAQEMEKHKGESYPPKVLSRVRLITESNLNIVHQLDLLRKALEKLKGSDEDITKGYNCSGGADCDSKMNAEAQAIMIALKSAWYGAFSTDQAKIKQKAELIRFDSDFYNKTVSPIEIEQGDNIKGLISDLVWYEDNDITVDTKLWGELLFFSDIYSYQERQDWSYEDGYDSEITTTEIGRLDLIISPDQFMNYDKWSIRSGIKFDYNLTVHEMDFIADYLAVDDSFAESEPNRIFTIAKIMSLLFVLEQNDGKITDAQIESIVGTNEFLHRNGTTGGKDYSGFWGFIKRKIGQLDSAFGEHLELTYSFNIIKGISLKEAEELYKQENPTFLFGGAFSKFGSTRVAVKPLPKGSISKLDGKTYKYSAKSPRLGGKYACNCFTADTKILTDKGDKRIEDIQIGDLVLSRDESTGEKAYKEVLQVFQKISDSIYLIHIGNQTTIEATGNHPFWVEDKGWVLAEELQVGDILLRSNETRISIEHITVENRQETVYNFEVADYHSYFVSELGVWVHNENLMGCGPKGKGNGSWSPESGFYEVGFEAKLKKGKDYPGVSDARHFQEANKQLNERFQQDPKFAEKMEKIYPGIVDGVKPGARGAYPRRAPTNDVTWHHHPTEEGNLQLVPRDQHTAKGNVQNVLHPDNKGGMENWGGGR
ncbi:S-layer homology domain-containing protein [Paenibacillus puerhi]|uniref:S-layer homology domain-containing protein n=1 Tax=Paenibacillus puerhi TaxID=2692622 RepID=UPI0013597A11|nr:S-layer homology domain-containing protein [Paenibacillus puerhi]